MFWDKVLRKLIENRVVVVIITVLIVLFGCYSYYVIPKQENPDTSVAAAYITVVYPGASPEEVDEQVTLRVQDALSGVSGIDYIQATSMNSASVTVIMFANHITSDDAKAELKDALDEINANLPDLCNAGELTMVSIDTTQFIISLSGANYSSEDLVEYAKTIRSQLLEVDGVTTINIEGERTREVTVLMDIDKMSMYDISIENVLSLMLAQNINIPSGSINYESGSIVVNTPGIFESVADIENTVVSGSSTSVAFVKLKDVATVSVGYADSYYFLQDGEQAVMLVGYFESGENSVNIGVKVRECIEQLKTTLPEDLIFHEVMYSPEDVNDSISGFILSLVESVLLIVFVVMVGVQLRNGIIISISIPLSIFITFIVMNLLDIKFQFISIAALIVSLGILVDNAIVISEAIQQHLNAGEERMSAVIEAVKETYKSVLTSTLTTLAAFAVLFFIPGIIGLVVTTIPTVVFAALCASYVVAMFITPVFAYMFFKPETKKRKQRRPVARNFFTKLLHMGLKRKKLVISACVLLLVVSVALATTLGIKFFPASDKPVIYINVDGETSSLDHTAQVVEDISAVLEEMPLIEYYSAAVGNELPKFFLTVVTRAKSTSSAQLMLQLNEEELSKFSSIEQAANYVQTQLDQRVTGATITVKYLEYSIPTDAPITIYVMGDDETKINQVAELISSALKEIDGTYNVRDTIIIPEYEYVVNLNSDVLSTYGLLKYDVVKQINTSLMGASSATLSSGGEEMDIVVRADIQSLDDLYSLPITSSVTGNIVKLSQVAEITLSAASPTIHRYNGDKNVTVLSNVSSGYSAFSIENTLKNDYLSEIDLEGITIETKGEFSNMMELIGNLYITGSIAVLGIFIIIYLQFKDFSKPLIIITTIPLSLIGCCLGLVIFGMDIQAMAILGAISLFGIVVNNGIVLLEYMEQIRKKGGLTIQQVCEKGIEMRCRPVMMTSITTCIGLVPLIVANDPMTAPMASVLMFGMLLSTFLTMLIVPVLYAEHLESRERIVARRAARKAARAAADGESGK